jgi:hypothetical protein
LGATSAAAAGNPFNPAPGLGLGEQDGDFQREGRVDESGVLEPVPFSQTLLGRAIWISSSMLLIGILFLLNDRYHWFQRLPDYLMESYGRSATPPPAWVQRWAHWNKLTSIERSFQAVNLSLRWLGKPQPRHVTPIVRARSLQTLVPSASTTIEILLNEHQSALFSPRPGDPVRARQAAFRLLAKTIQARLRTFIRYFNGTSSHPDNNP